MASAGVQRALAVITTVSGNAPSRVMQRHRPSRLSFACVEKINVPAPARE
jgi:hypothetical protein